MGIIKPKLLQIFHMALPHNQGTLQVSRKSKNLDLVIIQETHNLNHDNQSTDLLQKNNKIILPETDTIN
jgi:hypothetical protein